MEYLVLRSFRSYGKHLRKGEIVDASLIRSPRLRMSEGKLMQVVEKVFCPAEPADEPAVSSNSQQVEEGVAAPSQPAVETIEDVNTKPVIKFGKV